MPGEVVASLACVAQPEATRITGLDDQQRVALRAGTIVRIGGRKGVDVVVRGPNIVVSQASLIVIRIDEAGSCRAQDSGHNFRVRVNDEEVAKPRVLAHGDIIEPWLFDKPLGLRFRFVSQRFA
jgi:hypothetical protein